MSQSFLFPGSSKWPSLQSVQLQPQPSRCLVSLSESSSSSASSSIHLADIIFLTDAQRWTQSAISLELQYQEAGPAAAKVVALSEGRTLVQRVSAGSCHLLLLDREGRQLCARHWDSALGEMDADLPACAVYVPHFAKGVVQVLQLSDLSTAAAPLQLRHHRLITAKRVVAKQRFVAVEGCVLDNSGASVSGLAVFDTQLNELFCAAALPQDVGQQFTFTVTQQGQLRVLEASVDASSNRFRLLGFTSNGDVDFSCKLPAMLPQPWRVQLVRDELGQDFVCEENAQVRLWTPLQAYLRKERIDHNRLNNAISTVVLTDAPCVV